VPYTRNRDVCSENLRRGWVTKVKKTFSQDGATIVSSDSPETIWWDVATGARKDKVACQLACSSILRYTRGLGWCMHCGAEVTESSTNKQHHLWPAS
jgi:hypothetical protein